MMLKRVYEIIIWLYAMNVITSLAAVMTLSARVGQETWANTSSLPAVSLFESGNDKAVPALTASAHHAPQTVHSANQWTGSVLSDYSVVITAASTAPVTTSVLSTLPSSETCADTISVSKDDDNGMAIRFIEDMAASLHSLISARALCSTTKDDAHINNNIIKTNSSGRASDMDTDVQSNISMAVLGFPRSSLLFLNTTSPNYVLIDHANATVVVWRGLDNTPIAGANTGSRNILDKLNTALPYIEACGLVAIVWEISKSVHAKIQAGRSKRSSSSTSAEPAQDT